MCGDCVTQSMDEKAAEVLGIEPDMVTREVEIPNFKKNKMVKHRELLNTWKEVVINHLKEKFNISENDMTSRFQDYLKSEDNIKNLTSEIYNVAPYCDYTKLIDDKEEINKFFMNEVSKVDNWSLLEVRFVEPYVQIKFKSKALDEHLQLCEGVICMDANGIKHSFVTTST